MARRASRPKNITVTEPQCQQLIASSDGKVLNEVVEILSLPHFDDDVFKKHVDPSTIQIPNKVMDQLTGFVRQIAALYKNNPFHNFERKLPCIIDSS